ncbi:MAG: biopolymer transporter ExbD [Myxococcota bacterium]
MAGSSHRRGVPITGINVTPLVDIVLVLLIIFMVTAKLVVSNAIPMDLPKAATGGEVQQVFSVSLAADGSTLVDGETVEDVQAIFKSAKAALERSAEVRAVVQADGEVPHRRVMAAVDALRQAGLARIAFGVDPAPPIEGGGE